MTVFQEILNEWFLLGHETRLKPHLIKFDSAVVTGLPQLIWGTPSDERPCTLTMSCSKLYLTHDRMLFRKEKIAVDADSLVAAALENLKNIWYSIRYTSGQFEISTIDFREGTLSEYLKPNQDHMWIRIGRVSLGQSSQERCRVFKEELMQKHGVPQ